MMFVCLHAEQRKREEYSVREDSSRESGSPFMRGKRMRTLRVYDKVRVHEEFSLVECLTPQPFNFLLKSLLSVFGVESD